MQPDTALAVASGPNTVSGPRPDRGTARGRSDARLARLLSAPLQIEERPPSAAARGMIALSVLLVAGFFAWAALVPIREVTLAMGEVMPQGFAQTVQHLEGGIVAQVLVRDGDRVEAGAPLLQMDQTVVRAQLDQVAARRAALVLSIRRLEALATGDTVDLAPGAGAADAMTGTQQATFDTQVAQRTAELLEALRAIDRSREEARAAGSRLANLRDEQAMVAAMVERRRPLIDKGLMRLPELEAIERDAMRLRREIAAAETERSVHLIAVDQGEARRSALVARLSQQALQEIVQTRVELAEVTATRAQLADRMTRLTLHAPISGMIQEITVRGPGTVLSPGAVVAEIVPVGQTVYAEVRVAPKDIGHVQVGDEALVKVSTFDFVRFGGVAGVIDAISPDAFALPDGSSSFKARIRLLSQFVGQEAQNMRLSPGMTLTAEIVGGQKTFLDYLLKPVRAAFDQAMHER